MNNGSGLYKIVNKVNGKFYIGSAVVFDQRWKRHMSDLKRNKHDNQHLQNAYNKYGIENFKYEIYKLCEISDLLTEEQKELDIFVGTSNCYNIREDARCPVSPGSKRPMWIIKKIADAQRGVPRPHMRGIKRTNTKHSEKTKLKMKNRPSSYLNIAQAQKSNIGRIYSKEHGKNISLKRNPKTMNELERAKISSGVRKAIEEGRYHKNKIPKNEYENVKHIYLYSIMNIKSLATKYGVNPSSMSKLLKKLGVK